MNKKKWIFGILCWSFLGSNLAQAQQTIFNVPSADVTPKGQIFLQHESQFRPWRPGRFVANTEYAAFGIGYNTDIDATLFNVSSPASDNIALGLGFKTALPVFENKFPGQEFKITFGEMIPISVQGQGVGSWTYAHVSGRLPTLKTRLTAGATVGTKQIFGRTIVSFIGGYEQPVTERLTLIGDWYSGSHSLGLFIPGFSYALTNSVTMYTGYQIPNSKRSGSHGIVFELALIF